MSTSSNKELESFLTKLNEENRLLQSRLDAATQKISEQMRLDQPNQVLLDELLEKIDQLNDELKTVKSEQTEFETLSKQIKMINYDNIQKHIIDQFVAPKLSLINDQMGSSTPNLDRRLIDKIPKILFAQTNNVYTVSVTGFHIHHKTFNESFMYSVVTSRERSFNSQQSSNTLKVRTLIIKCMWYKYLV